MDERRTVERSIILHFIRGLSKSLGFCFLFKNEVMFLTEVKA